MLVGHAVLPSSWKQTQVWVEWLTLQVSILAGVFSQGIWSDLASLQDPELRELSKTLPMTVLRSKAPNTVRKYSGAYLRWVRWAASKNGIKGLPASPIHVALYMNFLIQKANTATPVQEAVSAISWAHQLAVADDPTKHPLVQNTLAGAKRILAHSTAKKEPITVEMLGKLCEKLGGVDASLADVRTLAICLIGFAGFLRYDELARLRDTDLSMFPDHVELFIESSKTDQFRDGSRVIIARTLSKTCPVTALERYVLMAGVDLSNPSGSFLFRGLVKLRSGYKLRASGGLSYTRARELVLEALEGIGLDRTKFGLHSLRSGGASAAANAGVPDRFFKRHGRWRSESAKDGYIKDSFCERLSVSRQLGM